MEQNTIDFTYLGWNWDTISDAIKSSEAWSPPTHHAIAHHADNVAKNHGR
jgi:hypothetical protein